MVSIAMATYNGEKYLRDQIDSILKQTIQDFELIICDDCSTDTTWDILQEYQLQDKRIKCYRNDENLGLKKNFEKAIHLCVGEYIALSDQDDIWLPEHLEKLLNLIGKADLACGNELLFSDIANIDICQPKIKYKFTNFPAIQPLFLYSQLYCGNFLAGNSMLLKREFVYKYGVLPIPDVYHDGWFVDIATLYNGFVFTEKIITKRRIHNSNETGYINNFINKGFFNKIKYLRNSNKKRMVNSIKVLDAISERFATNSFIKKLCVDIQLVIYGKSASVFSFSKFQGLLVLLKEREKFFFMYPGFIFKKICVYLFL